MKLSEYQGLIFRSNVTPKTQSPQIINSLSMICGLYPDLILITKSLLMWWQNLHVKSRSETTISFPCRVPRVKTYWKLKYVQKQAHAIYFPHPFSCIRSQVAWSEPFSAFLTTDRLHSFSAHDPTVTVLKAFADKFCTLISAIYELMQSPCACTGKQRTWQEKKKGTNGRVEVEINNIKAYKWNRTKSCRIL